MALVPITAAAVSLSLSKTLDTAAELSLTLSHSVSPSSSGGKKGWSVLSYELAHDNNQHTRGLVS